MDRSAEERALAELSEVVARKILLRPLGSREKRAVLYKAGGEPAIQVGAMPSTHRLAAILAADVAGYSRLMGEDEEGTLAALKAIRRELIDPKIRSIAAASSKPPAMACSSSLPA